MSVQRQNSSYPILKFLTIITTIFIVLLGLSCYHQIVPPSQTIIKNITTPIPDYSTIPEIKIFDAENLRNFLKSMIGSYPDNTKEINKFESMINNEKVVIFNTYHYPGNKWQKILITNYGRMITFYLSESSTRGGPIYCAYKNFNFWIPPDYIKMIKILTNGCYSLQTLRNIVGEDFPGDATDCKQNKISGDTLIYLLKYIKDMTK